MNARTTVWPASRCGRLRDRREHRRPIAAAAAAAVLLAASGCSVFVTPKDRQPDPPHATTGPPTASTSPDGNPTPSATRPGPGRPGDEAAILAAYNRFWAVAQTVDAQPQQRWRPLLADVTTEPLLSQLLDGYQTQAAQGLRQFGLIHTRPILASHDSRTASIADCQDASSSGLVDTTTGLPTMVGSARTALAATLARGSDGRWRVNRARYLRDPC